jgi:hypothetical protein
MNIAERFNIYTAIHKGLRAYMCEVLVQVGRMDPDDADEVRTAVAAVRGLVEFSRGHVQHEDEWIHPALEARRPGSSAATQADHQHHQDTFELLDGSLRNLERSTGAGRTAAARLLYRQLALFVAENFEHMHVEETDNHATLVTCYSEQEVLELNARLVAAVNPGTMSIALRWMIPYSNAPERAAMLGGMLASAPRPVFDGVMALIQPHLSGRDLAKLNASIGKMAPPAAEVGAAGDVIEHADAALAA